MKCGGSAGPDAIFMEQGSDGADEGVGGEGGDFLARAVAEAGVRLEDADGVAEGVVGGEDAVFVLEAVGEPFAEAVGDDGAGFVGEGAGGERGPGVTGFGGEGGGVAHGVVEDLFREAGG
jgi:hypothetical protein